MKKPEWARDFPRLYELYRDSDTASEANYFHDFEEAVNYAEYQDLDRYLQQLDRKAWRELKKKAVKYVAIRNDHRAYEELFNILNEVQGYIYLKSEGCTEVRFIPEGDTPVPDLYGRCGHDAFLLEVKTINEADDERDWIRANSEPRNGRMTAREVQKGLADALKLKIIKTVAEAREKLLNHHTGEERRRVIYLIIRKNLVTALDTQDAGELADFLAGLDDVQIEVRHALRGWKYEQRERDTGG